LLHLLIGGVATAFAQSSTVCNDDGTVTFKYKNDNAKEVLVDVQFAGRNPMVRDTDGFWTATLGPAAPDMYPYCFIVDGVSVMDPENDQYFPNEGFKNSLLEIPAKNGSLVHDIKDVPHGAVESIHYYSNSLGATNNAIVYLPPSYFENPDKKYPVFYLISGTTDTEEVYYKVGRVNYILDNLIADGDAEEMIVVLPYGNPTKLLPSPPKDFMTMGDVFGKDLTTDLMPYIESNYRTINDSDHRAIGGFSRGGNQGLACGLTNLDKFSYLCSYSSFTSTDLPDVYDNAADTNCKINLFWLGVGTDDFLYGNARDYMEFLDKKGIRSVKEYTHDKFGHTWMNAKYFLDKTLRLLFRKDASEEAMRNGQPALAATGDEPQFTPGVMARLFPRPIISPEYNRDGIVFRMKAPEADNVLLVTEYLTDPIVMERDSVGIWEAEVKDHIHDIFTYYFLVDGTSVADPQNMYLSPSKGFKPSLCHNPESASNLATMGSDIAHGKVRYDLNDGTATYIPANFDEIDGRAVTVRLIPGKNDSAESWFKVGGADALADRMIAEGISKPVKLTTSPVETPFVINADDYKTWEERRQALEKLLTQ
ncbi:MAG: hypothetical protein K2L11_09070, partial [Muribaculaceae bacterium]|nr:hypothetical protein [Muribaculaceae bacterium]